MIWKWMYNYCLLLFFPKQANLVAAFEQSLALMTTRLQSLSISHEQKVPSSARHIHTFKHTRTQTWIPAAFHPCAHLLSGRLRAGSMCANMEWSDFDHSLWWRLECRLEAQAAVTLVDLVWEEKKKPSLKAEWWTWIRDHIPAFFCLCICFGVNELIRAWGGVQCVFMYKCGESLLVLHALLLPLKAPV